MVQLTVSFVRRGIYTEGAFAHLEIFRYFDGGFPAEIAVLDLMSPDRGIMWEGEVRVGRYEIRSFQRPCPGSCSMAVEPPQDGCAVGLMVGSAPEAVVTITNQPGLPCQIEATGAELAEPERSMDLTNVKGWVSDCDPPSPFTSDGLTEVLAQGFGDPVVWALLWHEPPFPVGEEIKMVFRATGSGPFSVQAVHEDGTTIEPVVVKEQERSSYGRPGDEWGLWFVFPKAGCWNVEATRGDRLYDLFFLVEGS
ncbi:MAG: hypothetical protein ACE5F5_04205 [Acidimicrobiia bacterium]